MEHKVCRTQFTVSMLEVTAAPHHTLYPAKYRKVHLLLFPKMVILWNKIYLVGFFKKKIGWIIIHLKWKWQCLTCLNTRKPTTHPSTVAAHPDVSHTVGLVLNVQRLMLLEWCMQVGPLKFSATMGAAHELHNQMPGILQLEKKIIKNLYHSIAALVLMWQKILCFKKVSRKNHLPLNENIGKLRLYMYWTGKLGHDPCISTEAE